MKLAFLTAIILSTSFVCVVSGAEAPEKEKPVVAKQKLCFQKKKGKDITRVSLTINGSKVTGTMDWEPFEQHGSSGTLKGTIKEGLIKAVYDYTIEGSRQTEEKQFKLTKDTLLEGQGELMDPKENGNLVIKDPSKLEFKEALKKVDCKE